MKKLLVALHRGRLTARDYLLLIIPAAILLTLPIFIWATITQKTDNRGKAATTAPPAISPIRWVNRDIVLAADRFYFFFNNQYYWGNQAEVTTSVNPTTKQLTASFAWTETTMYPTQNMVMTINFSQTATEWKVDSILVGPNTSETDAAAFFQGPFFTSPLKRAFQAQSLDLNSIATSPLSGRLHFSGLIIYPYLASLPCFAETDGEYWPDGCRGIHLPGVYCTTAIVPLTAEESLEYQDWVDAGRPYLPACGTSYLPTPTPIPPSISATLPPSSCIRRTPIVNVVPIAASGPAGASITYSITLTNNDSATCSTPQFTATATLPTGWNYSTNPPISIAPGATTNFPILITSSPIASNGSYVIYLEINSNVNSPYHYMRIPVTYTILGSVMVNQTYQFRFKFDGVTAAQAKTAGAKIRLHIVTPISNLVTPFLPVRYDTVRGNYVVEFTNTSPIPAGQKVYFILKGEKHAGTKFCQNNQTGPCLPTDDLDLQWLTMPSGITTSTWWILNFTGFPLLAGDTDQDYDVDTIDFSAVKNQMSVACINQTAEAKARTDLDYDGCVTVKDIFLIKKTLETRYDPN